LQLQLNRINVKWNVVINIYFMLYYICTIRFISEIDFTNLKFTKFSDISIYIKSIDYFSSGN